MAGTFVRVLRAEATLVFANSYPPQNVLVSHRGYRTRGARVLASSRPRISTRGRARTSARPPPGGPHADDARSSRTILGWRALGSSECRRAYEGAGPFTRRADPHGTDTPSVIMSLDPLHRQLLRTRGLRKSARFRRPWRIGGLLNRGEAIASWQSGLPTVDCRTELGDLR